MTRLLCHAALLTVLTAAAASAQALPPGFPVPRPAQPSEPKPAPPPVQQPAQQPGQPAPQPTQPAQQQPAEPAKPGAPNRATLEAEQKNTPDTLPPATTGALNLQNASLTEVIDVLARQLRINYILDPRVKGSITINTYGETKSMDTRNLLDLILRINGFAMIQQGEIYRIVPLADSLRLPIPTEINAQNIENTDAPMLNLVFLKYAIVEEVVNLLKPFIGEGGQMIAYPPANLLLIQDSRRNMRRLMDLIGLFDSDTFAAQRVRLFELKEARPSEMAKDLETILKNISLSEKTSPTRFLAIDRLNTLVAVAPNPGVFDEIEKWIKKLDIPVKITAGTIDNYVYRVKYQRAEMLAQAIMALYGGYGFGMGMGMGYGMGMGMGGMYGGGMGMGGMYGGGMYGGGMYGGGMYGGGYPSMVPGFTPQYQPNAGVMGGPVGAVVGGQPQQSVTVAGAAPAAPAGAAGTAGPGAARTDQTGTFLGTGAGAAGTAGGSMPRIIPNPLDNTLLIQATPQDYAGITKLLRDLDIPPRQILIDVRIYEINLSHGFGTTLEAFLASRRRTGTNQPSLDTRQLLGNLVGGTVNLSMGTLVGQSRELLAWLRLEENSDWGKVVSAPSVIATDSIPASINVGTEVPTLTGQALTGFQQGGDSLFAQNIQNRNTGTTMNILARANASGVVTLVINQEVSAPQPPPASASIQSPSFSKRNVQTQVTVEDGDTIAIGGIIDESKTFSTAGIPGLNRIPIVGAAFGNRRYATARTEMIIFLTPRVIYDTTQIAEASEELRGRMRRLRRDIDRTLSQ